MVYHRRGHHHSRVHLPEGTDYSFYGCCIKNEGGFFEMWADVIAAMVVPPTFINGLLMIRGSQQNVIARINQRLANPDGIIYQPQPQCYPSPPVYIPPPSYPQEVQMTNLLPNPSILQMQTPVAYQLQIDITVIGAKAARTNGCLFNFVAVMAILLLFPFVIFCFHCFKKAIYPKYNLSEEFYRLLATLVQKQTECKHLRLTVIDNGFNAAKARVLHDCLSGSGITNFNFVNKAFPCNFQAAEIDDFKNNVAPIKSLQMTSIMKWGQIIV